VSSETTKSKLLGVQTFDPERTMDRARKVLPSGSWEALDDGRRKLLLRAAWVMSEADGTATKEERTALDQLAQFLNLGASSAVAGVAKADRRELVRDLQAMPRDRSFAQHLYAGTYLVGMSDGVLLDTERAFLDEVARAIQLDSKAAQSLEHELHGILYEELLATVFKDAVVSARERQILNASRKLLGLSEEDASQIEQAFRERLVRWDSGAY
jgi:tellurite resistance protein